MIEFGLQTLEDIKKFELQLVWQCAADTIQECYRSYRACRDAKILGSELRLNKELYYIAGHILVSFFIRSRYIHRKSPHSLDKKNTPDTTYFVNMEDIDVDEVETNNFYEPILVSAEQAFDEGETENEESNDPQINDFVDEMMHSALLEASMEVKDADMESVDDLNSVEPSQDEIETDAFYEQMAVSAEQAYEEDDKSVVDIFIEEVIHSSVIDIKSAPIIEKIVVEFVDDVIDSTVLEMEVELSNNDSVVNDVLDEVLLSAVLEIEAVLNNHNSVLDELMDEVILEAMLEATTKNYTRMDSDSENNSVVDDMLSSVIESSRRRIEDDEEENSVVDDLVSSVVDSSRRGIAEALAAEEFFECEEKAGPEEVSAAMDSGNQSNSGHYQQTSAERDQLHTASTASLPYSARDLLYNKVTSSSVPYRFNLKSTNLVIDKKFNEAIVCRCAVVHMQNKEVLKILDAIDINSRLYCKGLDEKSKKSVGLPSSKDGVFLPILHAPSLAATLTKFMHDHAIDDEHTPSAEPETMMTQDLAEITTEQLKKLVVGAWETLRAFILLATGAVHHSNKQSAPSSSSLVDRKRASVSQSADIRPSMWSADTVLEFLELLNLPENTMAAFRLSQMTGARFLCMDEEVLMPSQSYDIKSTLLRTRVLVYQQLLSDIDEIWDQGVRPWDVFHSSRGKVASSGSSSSGALNPSQTSNINANTIKKSPMKTPSNSNINSKSKSKPNLHRSVSVPEDMSDDDEKLKKKKTKKVTKSPKKKRTDSTLRALPGDGIPPFVSAHDIDPNQELVVEISPFDSLMQGWTTLNRAYGWNISYADLAALAMQVSGVQGTLVNSERELNSGDYLFRRGIPESSVESLSTFDDMKYLRWVSIETEDPLLYSQNLSSTLGSTGGHKRIVIDTDTYPFMTADSKHSVTDKLVLVPVSCMRVEKKTTSSSSSSSCVGSSSLAALDSSLIQIGDKVLVAEEAALTKACDRFDWWDRPPQKSLKVIAGQQGEIISLVELERNRRVGVRVVLPGTGDVTDLSDAAGRVFMDALPIEALFYLGPAATASTSSTPTSANASHQWPAAYSADRVKRKPSRDAKRTVPEIDSDPATLDSSYDDESPHSKTPTAAATDSTPQRLVYSLSTPSLKPNTKASLRSPAAKNPSNALNQTTDSALRQSSSAGKMKPRRESDRPASQQKATRGANQFLQQSADLIDHIDSQLQQNQQLDEVPPLRVNKPKPSASAPSFNPAATATNRDISSAAAKLAEGRYKYRDQMQHERDKHNKMRQMYTFKKGDKISEIPDKIPDIVMDDSMGMGVSGRTFYNLGASNTFGSDDFKSFKRSSSAPGVSRQQKYGVPDLNLNDTRESNA